LIWNLILNSNEENYKQCRRDWGCLAFPAITKVNKPAGTRADLRDLPPWQSIFDLIPHVPLMASAASCKKSDLVVHLVSGVRS